MDVTAESMLLHKKSILLCSVSVRVVPFVRMMFDARGSVTVPVKVGVSLSALSATVLVSVVIEVEIESSSVWSAVPPNVTSDAAGRLTLPVKLGLARGDFASSSSLSETY